MRLIFGSTAVATAGTRVQLLNTLDDVIWFKAHTRAGNLGRMFLGLSDVAATVNSWEFEIPVAARPLAELTIPIPSGGSVKMNLFYADSSVSTGEIIDWVAIVQP